MILKGQGTAMITLDSGEVRTIKHVLHILALKKSLIFVNKVTDAGYQVEFTMDSYLRGFNML